MNWYKSKTSALALCLFSVGIVCAQNVVDNVGPGTVDWSNQIVRAKGIGVVGGVGGRAGQIRSAELDALRQILETTRGMVLNAETTVQNYMLASDVVRTRIEGVVKNFRRVGDPVYLSNGDIELVVEMDMRGSGKLYDALLPPAPVSGPAPIVSQNGAIVPRGTVTGMVIDARGLGLRPAIAPQILNENGDEVYGSRIVDRRWAIEQGMVSYSKDLDKARSNERVTGSPMLVKAVKATGANRTDIVLTNQDSQTLLGAASTQKFLQECRVIVVVD